MSHLFLPGTARQVGQGGFDELVVLGISVDGVGVSVDGEDGVVVGGTGDDMGGVEDRFGVMGVADVGVDGDGVSVSPLEVGVDESVGAGEVPEVGSSVGDGRSVMVGKLVNIESCVDVGDSVDIWDSVGVGDSIFVGSFVDTVDSVGVRPSVDMGDPVDISDSVGVGWPVDTCDSAVEVEDTDSVSLREVEESGVETVGNRFDPFEEADLLAHVLDNLGWTRVDVTPQETIKLVTKHCASSFWCARSFSSALSTRMTLSCLPAMTGSANRKAGAKSILSRVCLEATLRELLQHPFTKKTRPIVHYIRRRSRLGLVGLVP